MYVIAVRHFGNTADKEIGVFLRERIFERSEPIEDVD